MFYLTYSKNIVKNQITRHRQKNVITCFATKLDVLMTARILFSSLQDKQREDSIHVVITSTNLVAKGGKLNHIVHHCLKIRIQNSD